MKLCFGSHEDHTQTRQNMKVIVGLVVIFLIVSVAVAKSYKVDVRYLSGMYDHESNNRYLTINVDCKDDIDCITKVSATFEAIGGRDSIS